ncbi:LOW QUALITY PROTEIN: probable apyrase 6 [Phalaenopsis equestris]|uniref:LOW QUALITY PROTEIN: probable apyrase 6 n=1 Tax=Phalaenopsis equestris TaxID=78828 RepID=UPI0009E328CF|nr:LOW QUALITY PROTEIN: probable apyrase 6 [Phalaenopsis equestris]
MQSLLPEPFHHHRLLCGSVGDFPICLIYFLTSLSSHKFGIIIDGGSTGTRIHLFGYKRGWGGISAIDFGLTASMKVVPGLSAFAENPEVVVESLKELLYFVKDKVPKNLWGETEVRLMATAGLRLLDFDQAEGILKSCRSALRESGLKFQDDWATVISGADEGLYAWIAANYALGTLGKAPQETTGIVELGGASAQITFVPSEPMPPEFSLVIKFGHVTYNLYSHSFLHLGQNTAYEYLHRLLSSRDYKTWGSQMFLDMGLFIFQRGLKSDSCLHGYNSAYDLGWKIFLADYVVGEEECPRLLCLLRKDQLVCLREAMEERLEGWLIFATEGMPVGCGCSGGRQRKPVGKHTGTSAGNAWWTTKACGEFLQGSWQLYGEIRQGSRNRGGPVGWLAAAGRIPVAEKRDLGEVTYNLYSHSFLHLGQNTAYEYLHRLPSSRDYKASAEAYFEGVYIDPCTPKGYWFGAEQPKLNAYALNANIDYNRLPHAFGNFSECRLAALMLLRKEKDRCSYKNCHIGSTFVPKLQGKLIATENFFHTSKFFGLGPSSYLSDLTLAGEQFCEEDWSKLRRKYHAIEEEDLLRYCFSSAYIVALLHDSLGIAMNDSGVVFANQVGQVSLDWALGAFIMQTTAEGANLSNWITVNMRAILPRLLSILIFFSILAFIGFSLLKWQKPYLKTKFDMEKRRYFNLSIYPSMILLVPSHYIGTRQPMLPFNIHYRFFQTCVSSRLSCSKLIFCKVSFQNDLLLGILYF